MPQVLPANRPPPRPAAVATDDPRHATLARVLTAHCLLELRFVATQQACQTALIDLAPAAGMLVLDTLEPPPPAALLADAPAVRLRTRLDGVTIGFATRIVGRGETDGIPCYQAPYPTALETNQRRSEHRVAVPLAKLITATIVDARGRTLRGELRDLSPGGFAMRITGGELCGANAAAGWHGHCTLAWPAAPPLLSAVVVRYLRPAHGRRAPRVGVCFAGLSPVDLRRLERYVAALERERVRLR